MVGQEKCDRVKPKQMFYYIQLYRLQNSQILYRMCWIWAVMPLYFIALKKKSKTNENWKRNLPEAGGYGGGWCPLKRGSTSPSHLHLELKKYSKDIDKLQAVLFTKRHRQTDLMSTLNMEITHTVFVNHQAHNSIVLLISCFFFCGYSSVPCPALGEHMQVCTDIPHLIH